MAFNYLKTGAAAAATFTQEQKAADLRKEQQANQVRTFWLKKDSSTYITFVDGDLDAEGNLISNAAYREHSVYLNGKWQRFVCTMDAEGQCPLCSADNYPSTVAAFTVIDHSEFTSKKGETFKDQIRLFPAKRGTFQKLQKIATKRKGLAGATFEVSRSTDDKSPGVGDMFDYEEKRSEEELANLYKVNGPVDYSTAIVYVEYAELCGVLGVKAEAAPQVEESTPVIGQEQGVEEDGEESIPF